MAHAPSPPVLVLPLDAGSPRLARLHLRRGPCAHHGTEVIDRAELLISELVTNAVRYGGPPITLSIDCTGDEGLQVRVSDGSSKGPRRPRATDSDESGRGIALVDLLSDDWGVEVHEAGKAVWFRLQL
jgi:anti-sigma regulatory factor (Ser/Thr protein kinase)